MKTPKIMISLIVIDKVLKSTKLSRKTTSKSPSLLSSKHITCSGWKKKAKNT